MYGQLQAPPTAVRMKSALISANVISLASIDRNPLKQLPRKCAHIGTQHINLCSLHWLSMLPSNLYSILTHETSSQEWSALMCNKSFAYLLVTSCSECPTNFTEQNWFYCQWFCVTNYYILKPSDDEFTSTEQKKIFQFLHCNDVIMSTMASRITSRTIVYSIVYSGADQRKHQVSASLASVWGIHRWPVPAQMANNAENVSIRWRHDCGGTSTMYFVIEDRE